MDPEKHVDDKATDSAAVNGIANEHNFDAGMSKPASHTEVPSVPVGRASVGTSQLGTGTDYVVYHDHRVESPGQITGLSVSSVGSIASEDGGIGNILTVTVPSPDAVTQADALTCSYAPELSARMSFVLKGAEGEGSAARRQADVMALLQRSTVTGAQALRFYPVENLRAIQSSELVYPLEHAQPGAALTLPEGQEDSLDHSVLRVFGCWVHDLVNSALFDPEHPDVREFRTSAKHWNVFQCLGMEPSRIPHHLQPGEPLPPDFWEQPIYRGLTDEQRLDIEYRVHLLVSRTPDIAPLEPIDVTVDDVITAVVETIVCTRQQEAASMAQVAMTFDALNGLMRTGGVFTYDDATRFFRRNRTIHVDGGMRLVADERDNTIHWSDQIGYYAECYAGADEGEGQRVYVALRPVARTQVLQHLAGAVLSYVAIARHEYMRGIQPPYAQGDVARLVDMPRVGGVEPVMRTPGEMAARDMRAGTYGAAGRAHALSNEFFILPVSADVTGRVAQAIADYFIAVRLIQLFPQARLLVRDVRRIPQTAEDISAWLQQPMVQLTIRDVENIRDTYAHGRDVCFDTSYVKYIAPLGQLSDKEALERPELLAIRARTEFDRMSGYLDTPHKIVDGQLIPLDCPTDLARDIRLQRFVQWVKIMRQVMNTPAEINRANLDADSRLRQANAYAEAMDCYCALEPYMLGATMGSKAYARTLRVDSAVPNHFTMAAQDVVFTQSYICNDQIALGNSTRIGYIRPDYQHTGDRRLSVNGAPGRRGRSHGLEQQVLIRTQESAEHQLNWINVLACNTGMTAEQFTRCYQIMVEQVVPTTIFGTQFRPWRGGDRDGGWQRQLMQRTAVGRLTRVINITPGLARQGVTGIMFPVTIGSCQSGAIQAHFVNNNFQVKVLNDNADIAATPHAVFVYDADGRPVGELAQRLHTMQPLASTYPLPQDIARY